MSATERFVFALGRGDPDRLVAELWALGTLGIEEQAETCTAMVAADSETIDFFEKVQRRLQQRRGKNPLVCHGAERRRRADGFKIAFANSVKQHRERAGVLGF